MVPVAARELFFMVFYCNPVATKSMGIPLGWLARMFPFSVTGGSRCRWYEWRQGVSVVLSWPGGYFLYLLLQPSCKFESERSAGLPR